MKSLKKKTKWSLRTSLNKDKDDFFASDRHTFIIRILKNGNYVVYDYRQYANMETIDFNFWGYSRVSSQTTLKNAKRIALKLSKNEV